MLAVLPELLVVESGCTFLNRNIPVHIANVTFQLLVNNLPANNEFNPLNGCQRHVFLYVILIVNTHCGSFDA